MIYKFLKLCKNEKGQSLVEFAIIVIPLLILVMGIIEFGWLFNGQIVLTSSAREGARVAAVGGTETQIQVAVANHVAGSAVLVDGANITVTYDEETVTVYTTGQIAPLVGFFVKDTVTLSAQGIMRNE